MRQALSSSFSPLFVAWTLAQNHLAHGAEGTYYKLIRISNSFLEISSTTTLHSRSECFAFCLLQTNCIVSTFTDGVCRSLNPHSLEVEPTENIPALVHPDFLGEC